MATPPQDGDPNRTSDLRRAAPPADDDAPPTVRRPDTSSADAEERTLLKPSDSGPAADNRTDTFDPVRTGMYTPTFETGRVKGRPDVPGFEILDELGRGGMGVVYKAKHTALGRTVALKMILAGPHATDAAIVRFDAEARAVARLQHPNVVQIYEVGAVGGMPYFALEFVGGGPLSKRIAGEPQPPRYAAETAERLARAVQSAHDRGIIHRDLKPANVLLTEDGTPKITDFGLAKQVGEDAGQTQSGQIIGTPSYMAPEQATGDAAKVGPAADVYALGAILYDLLTGRPPFTGSSVLDTLEMVRTREPVAPGQLAAKVPRDLETITLKCLQKDPAKRYASAGAFADDLQRYLDGRPIVARPVGRVERAWRWARRNPLGAAVIGLVFLSAAGASLLSWQLYLAKGEADRNAAAANAEKETARQERDAKEEARADEAAARKAEAEYLNATLNTLRGILLPIDDAVRNNAKLVPVRRQALTAALKDVNNVRTLLDKKPLPLMGRTEAIAYTRLAEVMIRANQVEESHALYQKAFAVLEQLEKQDQADPVAKRNLAAANNLLGDVEIRLGKAASARDRYSKALELRRSWMKIVPDHVPARHTVAQSHGILGNINLRLGEPATALGHFRDAQVQYAELPDEYVRRLDVRREVASLKENLGRCHFLTGDPPEAEKHFRVAIQDRDAHLKEFGKNATIGPGVVRDRAISRLTLGDFFLVRDHPKSAWTEYGQAYDAFAGLLRADPESLDARRDFSAVHYRVGATIPRLGSAGVAIAGSAAGPGMAARHFDACLRLRADLARIDPKDTQGQIELMLALGRSGKAAEAETIAVALLKQAGDDRRVLFQVACGLAVAADGTGPVAARCRQKAFDVIESLVKRGWKDRVTLETDPDLDAIRGDVRFATVLAGMPAGLRK